MKTAIIGVGRMGGALAIALDRSGCEITHLISRHHDNAENISELLKSKPLISSFDEISKVSADLIFICVPDSQIASVAAVLADKISGSPTVFHTSGALSSEILEILKPKTTHLGSFHPLVSVSDAVSGARRFADVYFCLEGEAEAVEIARRLVESLRGKPFTIAAEYKSLYHAAAVMTSGHTVALFSFAVEVLHNCGVETETAQKILLPLLQSTVDNLKFQTPAQSLTGTFSRTDVETMKRHLASLAENAAPEILNIYRELGERSLNLALEQGADAEKIKRMRRRLTESKTEEN